MNPDQYAHHKARQLAGVVLLTHADNHATAALCYEYIEGQRSTELPLLAEHFAREVAARYRHLAEKLALAAMPRWKRWLRYQPSIKMGIESSAPDEVIGTQVHTAWVASQQIVAALVNGEDADAQTLIGTAYDTQCANDDDSCGFLLYELMQRLHDYQHLPH